jgi:hypothetical protein
MAAKSKLSRLFTAGNRALLGARHGCDPPQGAAAVGTVSEVTVASGRSPLVRLSVTGMSFHVGRDQPARGCRRAGVTGIEELMTESEAVAAGRGGSCPAMCAYRTQKNVPETGTFVR